MYDHHVNESSCTITKSSIKLCFPPRFLKKNWRPMTWRALSTSPYLMGTFSSSFSRLAYLLMVGRRGALAPYVSLDGVAWAPEVHN